MGIWFAMVLPSATCAAIGLGLVSGMVEAYLQLSMHGCDLGYAVCVYAGGVTAVAQAWIASKASSNR